MSIKTDAYEVRVINTMRGTALSAWTPYAALASAASDPEAGTLTELSGTGYARVAVTFGAPSQVSGGAESSNSAIVDFGTAGGSWGTATHVVVYDASTSGEARYVIALTVSKTIASGDPVSFPVGTLKIAEL